jgi:hypothetical protein
MGQTVVQASQGIADSFGGGNSVSAPGAGSSFTSIAAPPAGIYSIEFAYALSGTAETALANGQLRCNGATLLALPTISASGWVRGKVDRITLDGTNPVQLRAAANSTGGSVYSGLIVLTRIG